MQLGNQVQTETGNNPAIVQMKGITKRFPGGVVANDHIDFDLNLGEIHALLGENGAGKSTLMNILYGLYSADSGEIYINNRRVDIKSPKDAIDLGIGMVHQNFQLIPTMTVCENIVLGLKSERPPLLEVEKASIKIEEVSSSLGLRVDTRSRVEQLSMGERQRVEIVKALYRGAKILILDEPTSVLTPQEIEQLFKLIKSMTEQGKTIVLITHKLNEVMAISDRVTVLRHGKLVANLQTKLTSPNELADKMVGHDLSSEPVSVQKKEATNVVLEVRNLWALNEKGVNGLKGVSFTMYAGEILGLAGVAGNGQKELAEVVTGLRKAVQGQVLIFGKNMTNRRPASFIEEGVGYIPEDRLGSGILADFTVSENLILEKRNEKPYSMRWLLNRKAIQENAQKLLKEYDIVAPSVNVPARTLSGGNLQKLLLAKILSCDPKILIAGQPTTGLDVGAAQFIRIKLKQEADRGVAVLLISGDLNEILSLSDRIMVLCEGVVTGIVPAARANISDIGLMMGGAANKA